MRMLLYGRIGFFFLSKIHIKENKICQIGMFFFYTRNKLSSENKIRTQQACLFKILKMCAFN